MSSVECLASRLIKLRQLRESLCEKEKNWKEAFAARDWMVAQLKCLSDMAAKDETDKEEIKNRIDDLLCVLDPGDEDE